jgi:hypothetical protein
MSGVGIALMERWRNRTRAFGEQTDSSVGRKRRDEPHGLTGHSERFTTGGEHAQPRRHAQERTRESRTLRDEMLAVVEHEQQLAIGQRGSELRGDGAPGLRALAECGEHRCREQCGIFHGSELHPPHTVGESRVPAPRGLDRESCLPAAAGADQREKSRALEQSRDFRELCLASNEAGQRIRHHLGRITDETEPGFTRSAC